MTLRPAELLLVAAELARELPGRPLQKVVAPADGQVALGFAGAWLLLSFDRRFGRVHLIEGKPAGTGETAPSFVMLLRKELVGLKFTSVEAVAGERVMAFAFARGEVRRRLLLFLFGNGPRLILLDEANAPLAAFPPPHADAQCSIPTELPPPREDDRPSRFTADSISAQIAASYAGQEEGAGVESARVSASSSLKRAIEKLARREHALVTDLDRLEDATARRRHADLLLAHLAEVPRGASSVVLPDDFSDGAPVTIALDPARSASDNAARIYHEYRRLTRGRKTAERRLAETRDERARSEARLAAIVSADANALASLTLTGPSAKPRAQGAAHASRQPSRALPYRAFRSATGSAIFVGKGADKNDELTFRVARGSDLWLHTRDVPGAHVVVPLGGHPIDEPTLLDAATLALWFSPARPRESPEQLDEAAARLVQTDVTYALRKLVKKPRGAAPGRVSIAGGKTIRIRLELERLRRLLASKEDQ